MSELSVQITEQVRREIEKHALEARPSECCGLLSGASGVISDLHPLPNEADRPEVRFFATPEDLFTAMRHIREADQSLLGIYHSHPRTAAYPSALDLEMAFYPEAVYFIISLEERVELRAFKIDGSIIREVEIVSSE